MELVEKAYKEVWAASTDDPGIAKKAFGEFENKDTQILEMKFRMGLLSSDSPEEATSKIKEHMLSICLPPSVAPVNRSLAFAVVPNGGNTPPGHVLGAAQGCCNIQ